MNETQYRQALDHISKNEWHLAYHALMCAIPDDTSHLSKTDVIELCDLLAYVANLIPSESLRCHALRSSERLDFTIGRDVLETGAWW